jgi:hypothetical protein
VTTYAAGAAVLVACPYCGNPPGMRCGTISGWCRDSHAARKRLALVLAAHADPALDAFFKPLGPCGVCGTPGLDQRHRAVDAIAGALAAGETPADVAAELRVPLEAVQAVGEWAARWPGRGC